MTQHYNLDTRDGEYDCYVSRAVTTILLTLDMFIFEGKSYIFIPSFLPFSLNFIIVDSKVLEYKSMSACYNVINVIIVR